MKYCAQIEQDDHIEKKAAKDLRRTWKSGRSLQEAGSEEEAEGRGTSPGRAKSI